MQDRVGCIVEFPTIPQDEGYPRDGLGHVDGNEIGEGTYTLYLDPRRGKRAAATALGQHLAAAHGLSLAGRTK